MTQHTPGRLFVTESQEHWGRVNCHITAEVDQAMIGSIWVNSTEQNRADARRLVACWNACEGIQTELLEQYYSDRDGLDAALDQASLRKHATAVQQRDELLEALKGAVSALDALIEKVDRTGINRSSQFYNALDQIDNAEATIAKVEGGAA